MSCHAISIGFDLGISKNRGAPKSSIINHPFWGPTPIVGSTPIWFDITLEMPKAKGCDRQSAAWYIGMTVRQRNVAAHFLGDGSVVDQWSFWIYILFAGSVLDRQRANVRSYH